MKNSLLILTLLLFAVRGHSQNSSLDYRMGIKLSNQISYSEYSDFQRNASGDLEKYTRKESQILHPTFAFQWATPRKNFHEVELINLNLGIFESKMEHTQDGSPTGVSSGSDIVTSRISIRYEYMINFRKTVDTRWVPSLGFAFNPYYAAEIDKPLVSTLFPSSEQYLGARFFATPRITYYAGERLFFDFNIPICLADMYSKTEKSEDPALPIDSRKSNAFNFETFPKVWSTRIGVGLRI